MNRENAGRIQLVFKGMAMGVAEVIPGVSGGTIAFITSIYERLLNAIKSVDQTFVRLVIGLKLASAWRHIDGPHFLSFLLLGMAGALVAGVFGISHLMDAYPEELWGFFFGLIIASAIYIARKVSDWNAIRVITLLVGLAFAYSITLLTPSGGSTNLFYVLCCGIIAISALILPGISGSFMLLLMGMYTMIVAALKNVLSTFDLDDLVIVAVFAIGCIIGLLTFARLMSWLFKHHRNQTLTMLTGIMLGSLNKIWPWRLTTRWLDEAGVAYDGPAPDLEGIKVLSEQNVLPSAYEHPNTLIVVICALVGFSIVFLLERTALTTSAKS